MKRYLNRPLIKQGDTVRVTFANDNNFDRHGIVTETGTKKCTVQIGALEFYYHFYEIELIT